MIITSSQARFLTYLDGSGHSSDEVGSKAAALDHLLADGYPVPQAAVITTAAYLEGMREHSLSLLAADLRTSALPDDAHEEAERAATERIFLSAPLPPRLERTIARLAEEFLSGDAVAVRSSVKDEDFGSSSVTGQYLTITGVTTKDDLEHAIRLCWASVWTPSARAHRRDRHLNDHHIAAALIVQQEIESLATGLAFSSDPGGREHLMRIRIGTRPQGDEEFVLRKDTLEVIGETDKTPPYLEDLARLMVRIDRTAAQPQEVTWIYGKDGLNLLRTEPFLPPAERLSLDDGFDTDSDTDDTYTPHGVIEMLPGVIPPLLWTINAPMLENAFRSAFADLGGTTPSYERPIVARFAGRAALNLSAICRVAESLPGGNPAEVERQYLGRSLSEGPATNSSGVHLFAALRSRSVHRRIIDDVELIDTAARSIAELGVELADLPVRRLVAYRQRIRDLAWRGYAAEVGASSAAGATYRALELLLERWLPPESAAEWTQRLTRSAIDRSTLGGLRSTDLVDLLSAQTTGAIREIIAAEPNDPRGEIAALGASGSGFLDQLDRVVRSMGSQAVYGDAAWAEDDRWIWRQLHLLAGTRQADLTDTVSATDESAELIHLLTGDKKWRRLRILTGQFVDLRARWLRRQVDETTRFLELREQAKNALLILGGEERRIIVEAATRLVASRQLPRTDLVAYLTDAELDGMLFGSCAIDLSELERRRTMGMGCDAASPLPDWFTGGPQSEAVDAASTGALLEGWATSPGRVTGTVRVVRSLADGVRLQSGDVLVAHSTDPSWTPLFLTAVAVVLETGGPLSHAAIVARELGLPAVLNVPQATHLLVDGETVSVDGTAGVVERLSGGVT